MPVPHLQLSAAVLGSPDARELAAFYQRLLGWKTTVEEADWVMLRPESGGTGLSFQTESNYVPPVWPEVEGAQQMMVHLDIATENLEKAVTWALQAGAVLADHQPQGDGCVMLDRAGHPFCLF